MPENEHLSALQPGARLNSYAIVAILGAGGFGITYKAREEITGREVAIKEYLPAAFAVRDRDGDTVRPLSEGTAEDFTWGLDRFRQEATLLIAFRHPNIVPVLAYFEANATGYLVMEFQAGTSLGDLLQARGVLSEAETRRLLVPLLDGVEEVHRHAFLHRDIKPDNIYVRGDGTPVLIDFGAARQALGEHSRNLTTLLTEGYAPFEQYAGSGNQGPWSDIYALAAVMFRCLVGKAPVQAPRRAVATLRGDADPLAPELAELRKRISPDFALAIEAGLRVLEQERPQSVADFRALLLAPSSPAVAAPAAAAFVPGAARSSPTLVPDAALRAGVPAARAARGGDARPRRRVAAFAAIGLALFATAGATVYFGDHRSWLPDAFRRAGTEPAVPSAAVPAAPDSARRNESPGRPLNAQTNEDLRKGLAEHQRRHLEQVEAERRQWETHKATEAERRRVEEEAAKREPDRQHQEDDRNRLAEEDKARAEEQRRIRAEEDRRRQDENRPRIGQDEPPRTGPERQRPDRQRDSWPPELPDPRRAGQRPGPVEAPPNDGTTSRPQGPPPSLGRPGGPRPGWDEY